MLLGALSALLLGATAGAASAEALPCHEAVSTSHGTGPAHKVPDADSVTMSCCVACVAAPVPGRPAPAQAPTAPQPAQARAAALPPGLSPAPEPGPPR